MGGDASHVRLFGGFLDQVQSLTSSYASPLYWTLQEFIYADGTLDEPIGWAAAREAAARPEFSEGAHPLMVYAEAMFPRMFKEDPSLKPFAPAMDILMADTEFGHLYDRTSWQETRFRSGRPSTSTMPMWTRAFSWIRFLAWARAMLG